MLPFPIGLRIEQPDLMLAVDVEERPFRPSRGDA
jgi:hypothetical protein